MIATKIDHGTRATLNQRITTYDRPRWCSVCGVQRETVHGRFVAHQTPSGVKCENSGKSVKAINQESAG